MKTTEPVKQGSDFDVVLKEFINWIVKEFGDMALEVGSAIQVVE